MQRFIHRYRLGDDIMRAFANEIALQKRGRHISRFPLGLIRPKLYP